MSDQSDRPGDQGQEPEWPTHCELCGTELASGVVDVVSDSDSEHLQTGSPGTVITQDYCPNPDCPGKKPDMAREAGPDDSQ